MIEAYLRANKMFVDYNEVVNCFLPLSYSLYICILAPLDLTLIGWFQNPASTKKNILILFGVGPSKCRTLGFRTEKVLLYSRFSMLLMYCADRDGSFFCF